jgi:hypothetical protein
MSTFLDLNDNCVTLNNLFNKITETFVNDATATVTIKDSDGGILVNAEPMNYVSGSDGVYRAIIQASVDLGDDGDQVTVEVDAVAGDGSVYRSGPEVAYISNRCLCG